MSNLKWADVAHYYQGKIQVVTNDGIEFRPELFLSSGMAWDGDRRRIMVGQYRPILRHLEDMTEGEAQELYLHWSAIEYHSHYDAIHFFKEKYVYTREDSTLKELIGHPKAWSWLISKGFDVFGLIESGQAIRKGVEGA